MTKTHSVDEKPYPKQSPASRAKLISGRRTGDARCPVRRMILTLIACKKNWPTDARCQCPGPDPGHGREHRSGSSRGGNPVVGHQSAAFSKRSRAQIPRPQRRTRRGTGCMRRIAGFGRTGLADIARPGCAMRRYGGRLPESRRRWERQRRWARPRDRVRAQGPASSPVEPPTMLSRPTTATCTACLSGKLTQ